MVSAADRAKGPARSSVWLDEQRGRTRKQAQPAGLDRAKIVDATVRLLDSEGAARFSMRRLAAELEVTAMSVYWYVDTKDDLLELALDAVFATVRAPDVSTPGEWREQLRALAVSYRAALVRHPWASSLIGTFLNIGPHSIAFALSTQQVMRNTGLSPRGQRGALAAVLQFIYGFGTHEGHFIQRCDAAGMSQDEFIREAMVTVNEEPGLKESFETMAYLNETRSENTVSQQQDQDFDCALELLVAGIEAMAARERA
ncbi:TetR/AcrR family transcriptional regulator [Streptomyces albipurpureus]|uniref:TetR/AcrR family transcriptional regulator C-terminal domain-containing protein n=1 Tax=Streptomyces albipurpureus TaxID=2897419 RepID=A0ABT0UTR4_9ACTN|nr:TetR/AcrR family transcriptional regulator C-terminal domain-containing protein [Streptomyces sp. CWNU-1]MCM2391374.1 TetR/AcrR family transcriptional regulator C-terminal domain-containing protein [Streptomyces sp. CWNU-1]